MFSSLFAFFPQKIVLLLNTTETKSRVSEFGQHVRWQMHKARSVFYICSCVGNVMCFREKEWIIPDIFSFVFMSCSWSEEVLVFVQ